MKKIATMLAAGVVALGASAQAAEVSSTEYALITIPMVQGASAYNLVGISALDHRDRKSTRLNSSH